MPDRAADHLTVALETTRVSGWRRALRWAGALAAAALGEVADAPDVDLVVRRRGTGVEVIRTHADTGSATDLLAAVEADLQRQSVEEFLLEWRAEPPA